MIIATLQFAPRLGEVVANAARADEFLENTANVDGADLLVCPEMALSGKSYKTIALSYRHLYIILLVILGRLAKPPYRFAWPSSSFSNLCCAEGYNFESLKSIRPYLEPSCCGPTALWAYRTALRFKCLVTVGYPETTGDPSCIPSKVHFDPSTSVSEAYLGLQELNGSHRLTDPTEAFNYNATLTVDSSGNIVAHYRKSFLYYTDATWSLPSPTGFLTIPLPFSNATTSTAFGICMDLNPQYFTCSWDKRELATHALDTEASMLVVSTAWLTRLPSIFDDPTSPSLPAFSGSTIPSILQLEPEPGPCCPTLTSPDPDSDTLTYWLDRLSPLVEADRETLVVVANRVGVESGIVRACKLDEVETSKKFLASKSGFMGSNDQTQEHERDKALKEDIEANYTGAEPTAEFTKLVDQDRVGGIVSTSAHYAGTSIVMALGKGKIRVFGILGRGEERILLADTSLKEEVCLSLRAKGADDDTVH